MQKKQLNLSITIILKMIAVLTVLFVMRCVVTGEIYLKGIRPLLASSILVVLTEYFFENKRDYYLSVISLVSTACSVLYIKKFSQEVLNIGMFNELVSFSIGGVNAILGLFLLLGTSSFATITKILIVALLFLPTIFCGDIIFPLVLGLLWIQLWLCYKLILAKVQSICRIFSVLLIG